DEPGIVMLLDVDSRLPMTIRTAFRPRLALAWAGGLMTGNLEWNKDERVYYLGEESRRFVGIIGSPLARDVSVQPYQEEPRDVPAEFIIEATAEQLRANYIPIIIAGSTNMNAGVQEKGDAPPLVKPLASGVSPYTRDANTPTARKQAKETYDRLLKSIPTLYQGNVNYYKQLLDETVQIETPDARLNQAFAWAKVGTDKGFATNPQLGTGLLAGFRTSGESERAGFAWFFGRDAMWTALALTSYGDFKGTRTALDFLKQFQRSDGKIPHEISQSAALIPWFTDYPYAWASADATPLYVIVHADLFRHTGDLEYLKSNWAAIKQAYNFTRATDTDNNGLIENTKFGHGWVEGGALYPPHEEIYMQGLWIEASRAVAELADQMNDAAFAQQARANAERTRTATENRYWLADKNFYAYATQLPPAKPAIAEPGPDLARRQRRLNELQTKTLYDEDTVLPAVPLWWHTLDDARAQQQIDRIGSANMATDWGTRIISNQSDLYDPLSYHYGSVWGLFTGWASVGAYQYGRPHVGYQALSANAALTFPDALGYVTELLSGDFYKSFGRSSHHQVWSEAMVVSPILRGMLGIAASDGGRTLRFAPQLPADWNFVRVRNVRVGTARYDLSYERMPGRITINVSNGLSNPTAIGVVGRGNNEADVVRPSRLVINLALPLDARVRDVEADMRAVQFQIKREGDIQRVVAELDKISNTTQLSFRIDEGTDVFTEAEPLIIGNTNQGLRILRVQPDANALRLILEGRSGREYIVGVRSPRTLVETSGVRVRRDTASDNQQLLIRFDAASANTNDYVRREISVPFGR
ncbi:MAG: GH116 family glycosyl hydrolase, partial [Pyrinomonadaceae bacterium MAG19_C2-C3]|nr:GH116 family glycosyl hydrolase [Pyrinomonadaceae bacterium MAG19_C2-C3]